MITVGQSMALFSLLILLCNSKSKVEKCGLYTYQGQKQHFESEGDDKDCAAREIVVMGMWPLFCEVWKLKCNAPTCSSERLYLYN